MQFVGLPCARHTRRPNGLRGRIRTCVCMLPRHAVWPLTYSQMKAGVPSESRTRAPRLRRPSAGSAGRNNGALNGCRTRLHRRDKAGPSRMTISANLEDRGGNDPHAAGLKIRCRHLPDYTLPVHNWLAWLVSIQRPLGYRPSAQSRYASRQWWAGVVSIHSLADGFYRPTDGATVFPCPIWCPWLVLTQHRPLTKRLSCH